MAIEESNRPKNTTEESAFFDAIRNRRLDEVREHARNEPKLLLAYDDKSFGATPLTLAVFRDDRETADVLLDLGVDPDRPSDWAPGPWPPLHCAIHNGNHALAEHLLSRGATLDVHTAAALNRLDDLKRLLDRSPERVVERGGDGCQPLHFAGSPEAAALLLERGADIDARDVDHYSTPAQYRANPAPGVSRFLFSKGAQADIFSAVLADDVETVQKLVKADPTVVKERINQKRFPPSPDMDTHNIMTFVVGLNGTPLQAAAQANRASMIPLLIDAGASVNERGGYDDATALHIAAWENNAEAAQQLIDCGAEINIRSGAIHNNSPAGWAIVAGSDRVFAVLMDAGAEKLEWFTRDAQAAVDGEFLQYKVVPEINYQRIQQRLLS